MTAQKKILDLTGSQYLVQKVKSAINDVGSSLSTHIADTDIHVTTADKNKWNNQTYVFRYSSTALVASSTNANSLLDNTDNLKVGDKVIDSSGVLFSITAIDTANSTFTVGSALIDLALDGNVVHTSGNETVNGNKIFTGVNEILRSSGDHKLKITDTRVTPLDPTGSITSNITWQDSTGRLLGIVANVYDSSGNSIMQLYTRSFNANNEYESHRLRVISNKGGNSYADVDVNFLPSSDNMIHLGSSTLRWKKVYATNYYYGNDNVEFSTKFVTTDTNQTVSGVKTFSSSPLIYNSDTTASIPQITLKNQKVVKSSTTETGAQLIYFTDKNNNALGQIEVRVVSNGTTGINFTAYGLDSNNQNISSGVQILRSPTTANFAPNADNAVTCGRPLAKWSDVQTYQINGLTPSSLGMPSDRSARIDISSYFTNTGTGGTNTYTVPANGYIYMEVIDCVSLYMYSQTTGNLSNYGNSVCRNTIGKVVSFLPVRKNDIFVSQWYTTASNVTLSSAYFIPCQGNV